MAMFNSYVSLPEGKYPERCHITIVPRTPGGYVAHEYGNVAHVDHDFRPLG